MGFSTRKFGKQNPKASLIPAIIFKSRPSAVSFAQRFFMRSVVLLLLLAGAGIIAWLVVARPKAAQHDAPAQEALPVSKHSEGFNAAVKGVLADYDKLTENFINWDSAATSATAALLVKDMDGLNLDEVKKDSGGIYETALTFVDNAKGELQTIVSEKTIRPQREAFNNLTDNLRQFLNTVKYDREKLYLQECPMAFDDTKPGQWLSKKAEIRNPYLGLHHPTYGKGMLVCGETKQTINHTGKE